ncbi:hypothetical protein ANCCAN_12491 [Ancylostoma caninum]|uniref:Uncharacterized protein n=1 Tax=Ancylostoma caninum TaxID=29170 RepID=A0A368GAZ8_ANCCA|nr:hypothetical protein ANCCAN_12491 [Ancylostoma caninum]
MLRVSNYKLTPKRTDGPGRILWSRVEAQSLSLVSPLRPPLAKSPENQKFQGTLFFGADPIYEENAALFSTVGQFFPLAIGNETKLSKAYVMPKHLQGGYQFQTMVHLDVITFLTKLTQTPFIDQFLMDNEGEGYFSTIS